MEESRKQYEGIRQMVVNQSKLVDTWLGGIIRNQDLIKGLIKDRNEDREMIKKTQDQVQQIYGLLKDLVAKPNQGPGVSLMGEAAVQLTPAKDAGGAPEL